MQRKKILEQMGEFLDDPKAYYKLNQLLMECEEVDNITYKALKFYGDKDNYKSHFDFYGEQMFSKVGFDNGELARACLEKIMK